MTKYTIFETRWGHFGLLAGENGLLRSHLPAAKTEQLKRRLLGELSGAKFDRWLFGPLQKQIIAYFEGAYITFDSNIVVDFSKLSTFTKRVLTAARDIRLGQTISYSLLAEKARCPGGSRAIGNAIAQNPLPLIVPCHRVIKSDGKVGSFSAMGGVRLKQKILSHEQKIIAAR